MTNSSSTEDLRILGVTEVSSPNQIHKEFPITVRAANTVKKCRSAIHDILQGHDDRILVIVGPCSVHDPDAALDYAQRLKQLRDELSDDLEIVMRVYFEKPRTTVGWKGLINDPGLDESFEINHGLRLARGLLANLNDTGIPAATEFLDLITPQYVTDLISWGAIGARTTESQVHRELASGVSCPVGFKNGTDGTLGIAVEAINSASRPHNFLSVTKQGHSAIFATSGNNDCHIILRGGRKPNYDRESVNDAVAKLIAAGQTPRLMVDFSHSNSEKQFKKQLDVATDVGNQIASGNSHIMGVMVESHINEGRQNVVNGVAKNYAQSITDACLGWDDSEALLRGLAEAVRKRRLSTRT
ncbi:MAG TPA: 3-deoxy-7-phosphoheptulonate synthase [Chromatiales bacterium]|jgi:3-deoxy-7-phosphoheptulonate synthase|nr:3-deoxy-7-phosphoheptulonate synthase AroG [Chromatiaceae bacterium]HIN81833.1 3-deoxy-7-phosphoheptulonate synthase [Chromatiales bacterium]HIO15170.1 3-deoxy-7-phosphoheptulonate synthase [Chromatiales bacterium]HIO53582.1 3-deoxy-7-phosphoheptulonate synthase [Chromatiales bacterium]